MSTVKSLIGATVALTLTASPVLAQSAQSLSLSNAPRATTVSGKSSKAVGGLIIPLIGLAAFVAGAVVLIADDEDSPDSP